MAAGNEHVANNIKEQFELVSPNSVNVYISCRNLIDLDLGVSKSDPFAVMFLKSEHETTWQCLGRTETIWNNLNPDFLKFFRVNYYFEKNQFVRFEIYEQDDDDNHELIGYYECALNKILTANKQTLKAGLFHDKEG